MYTFNFDFSDSKWVGQNVENMCKANNMHDLVKYYYEAEKQLFNTFNSKQSKILFDENKKKEEEEKTYESFLRASENT